MQISRMMIMCITYIRHRACAQACKGVPNMLGLGLGLGFGFGFWFVFENWYLGGRTIPAPGCRVHAGAWHPPKKPPKTIEKSMIRALELPGTSPERSGTAQDHLKARISHTRAAQDRPVRPPRRLVRPPRRHVVCPGSNFVCPGSSSVCPGSNSVCPGNTKFIEILLEK